MRSLALILCLIALIPPQEDPAADWVKKLAAGGDAERWKAVEALAALGDKARPVLEKCEDKWWAGIALSEIESRSAAGEGGGPTLITLDVKDRELRDVLNDIAGQAKIRYRTDTLPGEGKKVTLKLDRATWFETLAELARVAESDLAREKSGLYAVQGGPGKNPRVRSLGFETSMTALTWSTRATFDGEPTTILAVDLAMRGDPASPMLSIGYRAKVVEAKDDTGRSLLPKQTKNDYGGRSRSNIEGVHQTEIVLEAPAKEAKSLALLRVESSVTIAKKMETVKFEDVLKSGDVAREYGEVTVTLQSCKAVGEEYEVQLKMTSKKNRQAWPNTGDFKLTDADGGEYRQWGSSASWGGTEGTFKMNYKNPGGLGPPVCVQFDFVTETYARKVYFEFKDVPLK